MLLQVEIATKSLLTNVTSVRLVIVVSVHVECEIVNLKKRDCKIVLRNCRNGKVLNVCQKTIQTKEI